VNNGFKFMRKLLLALVFVFPVLAMAQEEKKFGIQFEGFIKSDIMFDSRQTINVREGHFLLYPKNEMLDPDGKDINANPTFHILSIQTRLAGVIKGPDALGAKTSGLIEGEFFGQAISGGEDLNGFRLRHAYVRLDWKTTQLLVGQYWHPLFNTNCFPGTVSFNTGAPFEPFNRSPQIRITQKFGGLSLIAAILAQRDFTSTGPNGASSEYARNAAIPSGNLNVEYNLKNESTGFEFLVGAGGNFKTIKPLMSSSTGYKTTSQVASLGFTGYIKIVTKPVTIKLHEYFGGNSTEFTMLGGYAVNDTTDRNKAFVDYTVTRTLAFWADINTNGKKVQFGLFGGYTKNLGTSEIINGPIYARNADIDYVYRVAPRVLFNAGKFRIAPEIEYTVAAFATQDAENIIMRNEYGKITGSKEIGNFRFLIGVFYFF
jgi:hypothetical protein